MLPRKVDDALTDLFENPKSKILVESLREDLKAAFPEISLNRLPERVRDDYAKRWGKTRVDFPLLLVLEPAADERNPPPPLPIYDPCCFPEGSRKTDGLFACHSFRFANVHDEVRRVGESRDPRGAENDPSYYRLKTRLKRRYGYWDDSKIDEAIARGFERALEKAGDYHCGKAFFPWFATIVDRQAVDMIRERHGEQTRRDLEPPVDSDQEVKLARDPKAEILEVVLTGGRASRELLDDAARTILWHRGLRNASKGQINRERVHVEQVIGELARKHDPELSKSPVSKASSTLSELYVAYGHHQDCLNDLAADHPALPSLLEVKAGIGDLIARQEASDDGQPFEETGAEKAVGVLARIQEKALGLLNKHADETSVANAAANLHWFSWKFKAAATLAVCVRHASRLGGPRFDSVAKVYAAEDCLRSFSKDVKDLSVAHEQGLDPLPSSAVEDSQISWLLLRSSLLLAGGALPRGLDRDLARRLPDADWNWWVGWMTGLRTEAANAAVRQLAELTPKVDRPL